MAYRLLTGATGLLGRYLLRDLLLRDPQVAVLVRPSRRETAEQRVDGILAHWENEWGRSLPRPVILTGDVAQPLLGLGEADLKWLKRNCESILHSAASLTFYEEKGEPWRTNVEGVRNVLQLCRETDIRVLEQVSSAYVSGLRTDRVYESELDVGQEFGNDYEKSKIQAEKLVRDDDFLQAYTVFRPSIIVGDSKNGYTSTFHGFYSPLRVAAALFTSTGIDEALDVDYLKLLGLTGAERKNYVPVDWVSDAMVSILDRRAPQNETYTLATEYPVSAERMKAVFERAVHRHRDRIVEYVDSRMGAGASTGGRAAKMSGLGTELFEKAYIEQFAVYRSYWRDDPPFDCSNTRAVLPDLPCPEITDDVLLLLCQYALDANFGFPPPRYDPPTFCVRDWICERGKSYEGNGAAISSNAAVPSLLGITVTGPGGGCWTIHDNGHGPFSYSEGRNSVATEARMTSSTFRDLVRGDKSLDDAVAQGRIVLYGEQAGMNRLQSLLHVAAKGDGAADPHRESP
jgi:thioester reductase-like protein